jgi:large repetitive protein
MRRIPGGPAGSGTGRRLALGCALIATATSLLVTLPAGPALALTEHPDETWGLHGKVYALAQSGNTLYVGGKFTRAEPLAGGHSYALDGLGAFDASTGIGIADFHPVVQLNGGRGTVKALALSPDGARLYVGGHFDSIDGQSVHNLAAVSTATGTLDPTFATAKLNQVNALLVDPATGRIYIGGSFRHVDHQPRGNLAALAPDGALDPVWAPSADNSVRNLHFASDGRTIFAAGHFTTVDGHARQSVARIRLDGSLDPWAIPAGVVQAPMTAWDMAVTPTRLYVGFGQKSNYFAALRLDDGTTGNLVWLRHTPGNVESIALSADGSRLFVGGHFGTAAGTKQCGETGKFLHGLAWANPATGHILCGWLPHLYPDQENWTGAWTLLATPRMVWVGGFFDLICDATGTSCTQQESLSRFAIGGSGPTAGALRTQGARAAVL